MRTDPLMGLKGIEAANTGRRVTLQEDRRTADWVYLASLNTNSVVLVMGCGWGSVPMALSEICGEVYVIDSSWEKIALLNNKKEQYKISNLYPIYVIDGFHLSFPKHHFDLIAMHEFPLGPRKAVSFQELMHYIKSLLKETATLQLTIGNRLGLGRLGWQRGNNTAPFRLHTSMGYKHILQSEGFSDIQFYAPLPEYKGVPLFYIPIEDRRAVNFFLRDVFPLCEMVSPEVKQVYALEYAVAKISVRLGLFLRMTRLMKFFVSGFCVIAKNTHAA